MALSRAWTYLPPALCALGGVVLIAGLPPAVGALLITLGSLGLVAVFIEIVRRQTALYTLTMAAGTVLWLGGNLLWLSGRIGVETQEGVRIDLNQTQLARMVGCARETLSREVSELRRLRAIDVRHSNGRKSLFVVNPEGLGLPS